MDRRSFLAGLLGLAAAPAVNPAPAPSGHVLLKTIDFVVEPTPYQFRVMAIAEGKIVKWEIGGHGGRRTYHFDDPIRVGRGQSVALRELDGNKAQVYLLEDPTQVSWSRGWVEEKAFDDGRIWYDEAAWYSRTAPDGLWGRRREPIPVPVKYDPPLDRAALLNSSCVGRAMPEHPPAYIPPLYSSDLLFWPNRAPAHSDWRLEALLDTLRDTRDIYERTFIPAWDDPRLAWVDQFRPDQWGRTPDLGQIWGNSASKPGNNPVITAYYPPDRRG